MIPSPGEKFDHLFATPADLAEHHGVLCGLLCLRDEYEARVEWLQLLKDENVGGEHSHEMDEFIDDTLSELSSDVLSFSPWLPNDSTALDERVNATWPNFEEGLQSAGRNFVNHDYADVNHGFHNDTTPRYDEEAAELAWRRTLDFFVSHLGLET